MNIRDKAALVALNISQWSARKYDKKATEAVTQKFQAERGSGRYNKVLIAREALKKIGKIVNEARTAHYEMTLPYRQGMQIIPSRIIPEYMGKMNDLKGKFESAYLEFVQEYPALQESARGALGDLYDPADYPSPYNIGRKFSFGVDFAPVPIGADLTISIGETELREMQAEIEQKVRDSAQEAQQELWRRLRKALEAVQERLTLGPDGKMRRFWDSLFTNVSELCDMIPKLNFLDDPNLNAVAADAAKIGQADPDEVRESDKRRQAVLKDAEAILKRIAGYAPTFGLDEPDETPAPVQEEVPEPAAPEPVKQETMADRLKKAGII